MRFKFKIQWRANNRAQFKRFNELGEFTGTIQEIEIILNLLRAKHSHPIQFSAIPVGNYNEVTAARKARELYRAKDETVIDSKNKKAVNKQQGSEIMPFLSKRDKRHDLKHARLCH